MAELHRFGLTLKDTTNSLRHATIITAIGFFVITFVGNFIGFKTLQINANWLILYVVVSVPLQELIFRGLIQAHLYRFGRIAAIAISSVLYASIHFQNPLLVILALMAGFAWGYSFYRARTLAGPIVSHAVLGSCLFLFVL